MLFSLSSWKKSPKSADGADAPSSKSSSSKDGGEGGGMRNKAMILIAVLGVGALGYKMFWPDSAPVKAAAAMPKMTAPAGGKSPAAGKAKPASAAPVRKTRIEEDGTIVPDVPPTRAATPKSNKQSAAPAPAVATPTNGADDTDVPTPTEIKRGLPKDKPTPSQAAPAVPPGPSSEILAPAFVDELNGYTIRFPNGWAMRTFASEPWVLDCGDGRTALISIGFSAFPADFTADNIPPEWVARRIKKRSDTTLHSQGYALIGGKKALWSKSTGPLPMTNGNPRMTRVNYIVPLHDGRVMEMRIATTPEIFDQLMPTMRQSVESFKFIPRAQAPQH